MVNMKRMKKSLMSIVLLEPQDTFISNGDVIKKDSRIIKTTKIWFMNTLGFKDDGTYVTGLVQLLLTII